MAKKLTADERLTRAAAAFVRAAGADCTGVDLAKGLALVFAHYKAPPEVIRAVAALSIEAYEAPQEGPKTNG